MRTGKGWRESGEAAGGGGVRRDEGGRRKAVEVSRTVGLSVARLLKPRCGVETSQTGIRGETRVEETDTNIDIL